MVVYIVAVLSHFKFFFFYWLKFRNHKRIENVRETSYLYTTFLPRLNSWHCQLNARRVYQKKKLLGEICLIDDLCIEVYSDRSNFWNSIISFLAKIVLKNSLFKSDFCNVRGSIFKKPLFSENVSIAVFKIHANYYGRKKVAKTDLLTNNITTNNSFYIQHKNRREYN